jgi:hypothetical protein
LTKIIHPASGAKEADGRTGGTVHSSSSANQRRMVRYSR